ncbi:hypothetical protein BT69DRAFT_624660 [Atractiella rhizophila]|nr:hypothetical protein BT69DRAFT_624660 [Atractiella rhizophila]
MELGKSQSGRPMSLFSINPPALENRPSSLFSIPPPPGEAYNFVSARPDSLFRTSMMRTPSPTSPPPMMPALPSVIPAAPPNFSLSASTATSNGRGFSEADLASSPGTFSPRRSMAMQMEEMSLALATPPMPGGEGSWQKMTGDLLNLTVSRPSLHLNPSTNAGDKTPGPSGRRNVWTGQKLEPHSEATEGEEAEMAMASPTLIHNPGGVAGGRMRSPTNTRKKGLVKRKSTVSPRQSMMGMAMEGNRASRIISPRQSMMSISSTSSGGGGGERRGMGIPQGMELVSPVMPVSMGTVQEGMGVGNRQSAVMDARMMNRQSVYLPSSTSMDTLLPITIPSPPMAPLPNIPSSPPRVEVRVETKIVDPNPELAAENESLKTKLSSQASQLSSVELRLTSTESAKLQMQSRLSAVETEKEELMDLLDKQRGVIGRN